MLRSCFASPSGGIHCFWMHLVEIFLHIFRTLCPKFFLANSIKPLVNSINQFAKVPESRLLVALGFRNHFTGLNPLTDRNRKKDAKSVLVPVISIRGKNLSKLRFL